MPKRELRHLIIIDTNLFMRDFSQEGYQFQGLYNFLEMTNSKLLIPDVVEREVFKNFAKNVNKAFENVIDINKKYPKSIEITKPPEKIIGDFKNMWHRRNERNGRIEVLGYDGIELEHILIRSLAEKPPFGLKSKGFRDGIIWHTVLQVIKENPSSKVSFLTDNSTDFGKESLLPELVEELGERKSDFFYHSDIGAFLETHGEKIRGIDREKVRIWLAEIENLLDIIAAEAEKEDYNWSLDLFEYEIDQSIKKFSFGKPSLIDYRAESFYIFAEDDDYYYLQVEVLLELSIPIRIQYYRRSPVYEPETDTYDYDEEIEDDFDAIDGMMGTELNFRISKIDGTHELWD